MTDQKFSNGDRIKVSFEAEVAYASLGDIDYITFSNGQELEFPEVILPDDVIIEKIAKPLEEGWYLAETVDPRTEKVVYYFQGDFYSEKRLINYKPHAIKYAFAKVTRLEPVE